MAGFGCAGRLTPNRRRLGDGRHDLLVGWRSAEVRGYRRRVILFFLLALRPALRPVSSRSLMSVAARSLIPTPILPGQPKAFSGRMDANRLQLAANRRGSWVNRQSSVADRQQLASNRPRSRNVRHVPV